MGSYRITIEWEGGAAWMDATTPPAGMGRVYEALGAAVATLRGSSTHRPARPLTRAGTLPVQADPQLARALADHLGMPRHSEETPHIYVDGGCLEVATWGGRRMPPQPEWTEEWLREHVDEAIRRLLDATTDAQVAVLRGGGRD